jgi:hypothetical protein
MRPPGSHKACPAGRQSMRADMASQCRHPPGSREAGPVGQPRQPGSRQADPGGRRHKQAGGIPAVHIRADQAVPRRPRPGSYEANPGRTAHDSKETSTMKETTRTFLPNQHDLMFSWINDITARHKSGDIYLKLRFRSIWQPSVLIPSTAYLKRVSIYGIMNYIKANSCSCSNIKS